MGTVKRKRGARPLWAPLLDNPAASVTAETTVDDASAQMFYDLYLAAFAPMRARAAARNVLHRDEFFAEMVDPRVSKYVAWAAPGQPVGLTTLTNDLHSVPWVSPEYFAAQYPEHTARNAVYYLGFTLVHPDARRGTTFTDMIGHVLARLVADRAVVGCDICAFNNTAHSFDQNIITMLTASTEVTVEVLDTQTYYSAVFDGLSP
ncbi:MAG: hypothetical protein ACXVGR_15315 [Mycobacteriaceae bacterium]